MRGRKRKSAQQRRAEGGGSRGRGHRPILESALVPAAGRPACPEWFDASARGYWLRALRVGPWLTSADEFKLSAFCLACVRLEKAGTLLQEEGDVIGTKKRRMPHPALASLRLAMVAIGKLGSDLGFDPAARARVGKTDADKEKEAGTEEFFGGPRLAQDIEAGSAPEARVA